MRSFAYDNRCVSCDSVLSLSVHCEKYLCAVLRLCSVTSCVYCDSVILMPSLLEIPVCHPVPVILAVCPVTKPVPHLLPVILGVCPVTVRNIIILRSPTPIGILNNRAHGFGFGDTLGFATLIRRGHPGIV